MHLDRFGYTGDINSNADFERVALGLQLTAGLG
jgi:hypothetical protein